MQPRAEQGLQRSGVLDALLRTGGVGGAADGLIAGGQIRAFVQHGADGGTGSALPGVLRQRAEHIQRGGGGRRQLHRGGRTGRHVQVLQHRGQRGAGGGRVSGMGGGGPAQPEILPCDGQRLIKADAFAQDFIGKAVGQLGPLRHHQVAVRVGQKPLVAGRLWELALQKAHHKHGIGLGQAHTARRRHNDAVKALRYVSHIRRAQQQREQLGVVRGGKDLIPQQPRQLVQQTHDNVPLPQYLICVGQTAPVTQRGGQTVQRILGSEGLQEQVKLLCQRGGGRTGGLFHKGGDALHQKRAGGLGVGKRLHVLLCVAPGIARRAAGEGPAPVGGSQRPGVGVVFQCALLGVRQVNKAGFQQTQHAAARHTAQQIQRGVHGAGRGGILGAGCLVAEKRDVLQAELIPQRR